MKLDVKRTIYVYRSFRYGNVAVQAPGDYNLPAHIADYAIEHEFGSEVVEDFAWAYPPSFEDEEDEQWQS